MPWPAELMVHVEQEGNLVQPDLSSWCWFKLPESDSRRFIVGRVKCCIIWKTVSWCNTTPCAQGGVITLDLFSKGVSPLPRRWVLMIG